MIEVSEEESPNLEDYARIPISFEVREVCDVVGFTLSARKVEQPYLKDYDAIAPPLQWPLTVDISKWTFFAAHRDGVRVGGAAVALDTDVAVLWDIRVAAEARGQGVGAALFRAAEEWAATAGCRRLTVETQNINVPACRFYAKQGCVLGEVDRFAYPELPDETQLIWYKDLP